MPGMSPDPSRLRDCTGMADIDQLIRACTPGTGLRVGPLLVAAPPAHWSASAAASASAMPRRAGGELPPRPATAMVGGRPWKPFGEYGPKPMARPQTARRHASGEFSRGSLHYM